MTTLYALVSAQLYNTGKDKEACIKQIQYKCLTKSEYSFFYCRLHLNYEASSHTARIVDSNNYSLNTNLGLERWIFLRYRPEWTNYIFT